jgi:hypothetical protein
VLPARALRACPEHERALGQPPRFRELDGDFQVELPPAALHDLERVLDGQELRALSGSSKQTLLASQRTLGLMDELGRHQGVSVLGLSGDAPLLIVPPGRSPVERFRLLARARGKQRLRFTDLLRVPSELEGRARTRYEAVLETVLPGRKTHRPGYRYGKLVATECRIEAWEKFLLLSLGNGQVAFASRTGFLRFDPGSASGIACDGASLSTLAQWGLERRDPHSVSLRSAHGTYLRWGVRDSFELDARAPRVETQPIFQSNRERFFLWANGDGTVTLKLADNRVSVSVVEWEIPRQGLDVNCHYFGYVQDPSQRGERISISLGTPR